MIELTRFAKIGGPLTKRIALSADGALMKDGSACIMSNGRAQRARFDRLDDVAELIQSLGSHEAISLGSLRPDLPDQVEVTTQDKLTEMNGLAPAGLIARNSSHVSYYAGRPALALLDIDTKGIAVRGCWSLFANCRWLDDLARNRSRLQAPHPTQDAPTLTDPFIEGRLECGAEIRLGADGVWLFPEKPFLSGRRP